MQIQTAEELILILIRDHLKPLHTPVRLYAAAMLRDLKYYELYDYFIRESEENREWSCRGAWKEMTGRLFDRPIGKEGLRSDLADILTKEEVEELGDLGVGIYAPEEGEPFGRPDAVPRGYSVRHEADLYIVELLEDIGAKRAERIHTGEWDSKIDPERTAGHLGAIYRAFDEELRAAENETNEDLVYKWIRLTKAARPKEAAGEGCRSIE